MLAVLWYLSGFSVKAMLASKCVSKCFPPVFLVVPSSPPPRVWGLVSSKIRPSPGGFGSVGCSSHPVQEGAGFISGQGTYARCACVRCLRAHACVCVRIRAHAYSRTCMRACVGSQLARVHQCFSFPSPFLILFPPPLFIPFPPLPLPPSETKKKKKKGPEFLFVAEVFAYWFNLFVSYGFIPTFYFFVTVLGFLFLEIFSKLAHLLMYNYSQYFL